MTRLVIFIGFCFDLICRPLIATSVPFEIQNTPGKGESWGHSGSIFACFYLSLKPGRRWPVTYLCRAPPNVFAFLSWPHNTAALSPAGAEAAPQFAHINLRGQFVYTLTDAALGLVVVDVADVARAAEAALLILAPGGSTHTWVITLVHVWKINKTHRASRVKVNRTRTTRK